METITQTLERLVAVIQETAPDADLAPGSVLRELLIKLSGNLQNEMYNTIIDINDGKTVAAVIASGDDTYNEVIDKLASNYNVTRNAGRKVIGKIKVIVSENRGYFIPTGLVFIQPNLNFTYVTTNAISVTNGTATGTQVQLRREGSLYSFVVDVEASDIGTEKNNTQVTSGTKFSLSETRSISSFVEAIAHGNFSGGQNKETDKELIARFQEGLSHKSVVSPIGLSSVLKTQFPTIKNISVVGINDPELLRHTKNIFGFAIPGLADIYVRASDNKEMVTQTFTATKITPGNPADLLWRIEIPGDAVPGFYAVESIVPANTDLTGTYVIKDVVYGNDNGGQTRINQVNDAYDARFTTYQSCTVDFEFEASELTTADFLVTFSYTPGIGEIQSFLLSDENRPVCADYLVKAVVPCEVSLGLRLFKKFPLDEIPIDQIKQDIFEYVNNLPFGEDLVISEIIDICHNYSIKRVDLPIFAQGRILIPGIEKDAALTVDGEDVLAIPNKPTIGVTRNTTAFFLNYIKGDGETDNISIEVL